jgi:hypothetical protein
VSWRHVDHLLEPVRRHVDYALTALPGTVAHELAHFVVAFMFGARPAFPSLLPVRTQRGWQLGSVPIPGRPRQGAAIAMAPLLLAPLALWWASALLHPAVATVFLHVWIVAALFTGVCLHDGFQTCVAGAQRLALLVVVAAVAGSYWRQY